uniref:Transmembrane protein n=1 Tax=Toxoplasma gondii COUG TaxID=1074873 RepID=A0A2G8XWM8_TOXGO|nr:hypothetical protein TGCOUG_236150 [Toxoplasma gondii COUG]
MKSRSSFPWCGVFFPLSSFLLPCFPCAAESGAEKLLVSVSGDETDEQASTERGKNRTPRERSVQAFNGSDNKRDREKEAGRMRPRTNVQQPRQRATDALDFLVSQTETRLLGCRQGTGTCDKVNAN